jgi:hypothetical protein
MQVPFLIHMVRPERFELPASWFVARRSIQLSYGRNGQGQQKLRLAQHDREHPVWRVTDAFRMCRSAQRGSSRPKFWPGRVRGANITISTMNHHSAVEAAPASREGDGDRGRCVGAGQRRSWRRGRDSNPRRAFDPYALSRGAPSTTRPPLRFWLQPFAERGIIPARSSLGKANWRA